MSRHTVAEDGRNGRNRGRPCRRAVTRWYPPFCLLSSTPIVPLGFTPDPDRCNMVRDAPLRQCQPLRAAALTGLGLASPAETARTQQTSKTSESIPTAPSPKLDQGSTSTTSATQLLPFQMSQ